MRTSAIVLGVCSLALALAAPAIARPVMRQGVPVEALTPVGLERVRVRVPRAEGQPVRLTYAAAGTRRAQVLIEVVVGADAEQARVALEHWRHQLARDLPVVDGVGDEAYGTSASIAFVRDNVMVAVRRVDGEADILELATTADAAVMGAPRGRPTPARLEVAVPPTLARGEDVDVAAPSDVLAADVRVEGPARVRRTRDGWRLSRTADGAVRVRMVAVDGLLRVTR